MYDDGYNQKNKNWIHGHVYVLDYGDGKTFKIGSTIHEPESRAGGITKGLPVIMPKMELVMSAEIFSNCRMVEQLIHMHFDQYHIKGEWFNLEFIYLLQVHTMLAQFGSPRLYGRWYELIPEDAIEARQEGKFDWLHSLPFLSKDEEDEFGILPFSDAVDKVIKERQK